jgi:hypothetical protein
MQPKRMFVFLLVPETRPEVSVPEHSVLRKRRASELSTGFPPARIPRSTVGFVLGQRRAVTIRASDELLYDYDQKALVATLRAAFASSQPAGSEPVALTYNLALT